MTPTPTSTPTSTSTLTAVAVKEFWRFMSSMFGSTVEEKNDSLTMKVAAGLLDVLGIVDRDAYMKNFVTTLGRVIYVPFEIGVEAGRWSLWSQVRVCAHEHQHVVQGDRDGWAIFDARYLLSSSFRAGYEAEAMGADMEMEFWRTGEIIDYEDRVDVLSRSYGCSAADVGQALATLAIRASVVEQGIIETRAAQVAIPWLDANVPSLRRRA